MTDKTFIDIDNAREEDQKRVMSEIAQNEHCPFCLEQLQQYHKEPILKESEHWVVTTNQWPYEHTKHHFLLITKKHFTSPLELSPEASQELMSLTNWLIETYRIPGGGLAMRFGDSNYSAGSVTHLHAQLIQPDLEDPDYAPVRVKLGKNPDQIKSSEI